MSSFKGLIACGIVATIATSAFVGATWNELGGREMPFVSVRVAPLRTQTGKVFSAFAPGQIFRVPEGADGLDRIDVNLVLQAPNANATPKLVLDLRRVPKDRELAGSLMDLPIERSALMDRTSAAQGQPLWVSFPFEPIQDSEGEIFHLSLRAAYENAMSDWTPWTSVRGRFGASNAWGAQVYTPPIPPFVFRTMFDELSVIGVAVDGLDAAAAEVSLDLYELPEDDPEADGVLVRTGTLGHRAPLAAAYALFSFEPLSDARWKQFRMELNLPSNARVVGNENGISQLTYHGAGDAPFELVGQTLGEERFTDRDLVFRAFASGFTTDERLKRAPAGFSLRACIAVVAWLLCCAGVLRISLVKD